VHWVEEVEYELHEQPAVVEHEERENEHKDEEQQDARHRGEQVADGVGCGLHHAVH